MNRKVPHKPRFGRDMKPIKRLREPKPEIPTQNCIDCGNGFKQSRRGFNRKRCLICYEKFRTEQRYKLYNVKVGKPNKNWKPTWVFMKYCVESLNMAREEARSESRDVTFFSRPISGKVTRFTEK